MDVPLYLFIAQFKKALAIKPNLAEAHNNLASAYYLKGIMNWQYSTAIK